MKDVFISYKSEEYEEASWVKSVLEENGISCWMAPACIPGGSSYAEEIPKAIRGAKALVLVLSSISQSSRWVSREVDLALNEGKVVMPFMLENCALKDDFNFYLTNVQRYAAYENKAAAMEKMIRELKAIIGNPAEAGVMPTGAAPDKKPKDAVAIKQPKTAKKKSNKAVVAIVGIAVAAILFLGIIIALIASLLGGDSDEVSKDDSVVSVAESSSAETQEIIEITMSDNLFDFTFELQGVVYKLPCDFQRFVDNGWTISSQGVSADSLLRGDSYETFYMSKDGKTISVSAYNFSGDAKAVRDCRIGEITCELSDGLDFKIAKNITAASAADDIKAAFGAPNQLDAEEEYDRLKYYTDETNNIAAVFYCYKEGKYSSISLKNFIRTDADKTETNTAKPDYLSQYIAPAELGSDIFVGVISIDNKLYRLPSTLGEFLDNGWTVATKPSYVVAGGTDFVKLSKDGKTLELNIINYAEYQTTPENCAVYKVSVNAESNVNIILANTAPITIGMKKSELESVLPDSFNVYEGIYNISYTYSEYKERDYSVSIRVNNETELVASIEVSYSVWDYS